MSAPEHAVPERFFNDPAQCNMQGTATPTPGLPDCPQGISAVKALGIAAAQGQRIYTITQKVYNDNPGIVNTALSAHSYDTQNRVQQSLDAGYEVTIHESPIAESGWAGAGYTAIDPSTGAGAYTIEGGSNGGILLGLALGLVAGIAIIVAGPILAAFVGAIGFAVGAFLAISESSSYNLNFNGARVIGLMAGIVLSIILGGYVTVSFPIIFVGGLAWLLFTVTRLLITEVFF